MTDPAHRRLALGDQLRLLRESAGLSGKRLAEQLRWQPSKVSRIENARQAVTDSDLVAVCRAVGATAAQTEEVRDELRAIRVEEARWSKQLRVGHRAVQEAVGRAERDARRIRVFSLTLVPGLIQTAEYAQHVFESLAELHDTPRDTAAAVRARLDRQQVLYDEGKAVELLMTEFALRYPVAPARVMLAQIARIMAVQGVRSVQFGIVPEGVMLPAAVAHSFVMKDDVVSMELINTEVTTREAGDVALFGGYLDRLWELAVEDDAAREILARHATAIRSTTWER